MSDDVCQTCKGSGVVDAHMEDITHPPTKPCPDCG